MFGESLLLEINNNPSATNLTEYDEIVSLYPDSLYDDINEAEVNGYEGLEQATPSTTRQLQRQTSASYDRLAVAAANNIDVDNNTEHIEMNELDADNNHNYDVSKHCSIACPCHVR